VGAQLRAPQQGHHCQQVPCTEDETCQQAQKIQFVS
jgi:hypothetical protein